MVYDFNRLDEHRFEDLCRALALRVLGCDLQAFGAGADGGREASFEGRTRGFAEAVNGWDGYGVLQAKFRRVDVGTRDAEWLRVQMTKELDAWLDPQRRRVTQGRMPEYLLVATNLRLSRVPKAGGSIAPVRCWPATRSGSD